MIFNYNEFSDSKSTIESGLFVVSTPIGNIEDITIRAIKILRSVDYIICEHHDITSKLLKYYQINTKLLHYNDDMPSRHLKRIYDIIDSKKSVALVSDAGTPLISDPGWKIIDYVVSRDDNLISVPGACSFLPALTSSGFRCSNFYFYGFLPKTEAKSKKILNNLVKIKSLLIFFESPHRLLKTLNIFYFIFGENVKISVSKEITKLYEEKINGTVKDVLGKLNSKEVIKGEYIIIIDNSEDDVIENDNLEGELNLEIDKMIEKNISTKDIMDLIIKNYNNYLNDSRLSKSNLYKRIIEVKKSIRN